MATPRMVNPERIVARMIAELEADPAIKPLLLRSALTTEFLLLPPKVDLLTDQVEQLMELPPKVDQLTDQVEQLMELPPKVDRLTDQVEQLMELPPKVEQLMELVPKVEQLMELPAQVNRMQGQLNNLAGNDYERRVVRMSRSIVRRPFNLRHARVLQAINKPDNEVVPDLANDAVEQGRITEDELRQLLETDLVLLDTASAPEPVYVVAEISITLDDHDVDRAARRARILRAATGNDAHPAVIGTAISGLNRRRAEDNGVTVILVAEQE